MKRINTIWNSHNVNYEDWNDYFKESFPDENLTEDDKISIVQDDLSNQLDDEEVNLNITLDNPIIAIVSLGLWSGRKSGYKIIESGNIRDIFSVGKWDEATFYADANNVRATLYHHDGQNYVTFRELKADMDHDEFKLKILNGAHTSRDITRHTKSILPSVAEVYGWKYRKY